MASTRSGRLGLRRIDLAYAAGFVDGEGCFRFCSGSPRLSVANCYPAVLTDLCKFFGGSVRQENSRRNGRCRVAHVWSIGGDACISATRLLLPYLKEKQAQAVWLLLARDYPPRSAMRELAHSEIKTLKHIDHDYHAPH